LDIPLLTADKHFLNAARRIGFRSAKIITPAEAV
jgi:hypothetical protein